MGCIRKSKGLSLLLLLLLLVLVIAVFPKGSFIEKSFAVESYYVGVYRDFECTEEVLSITWGNITPGSSKEINIFVRNEELTNSCYLSLQTENWTPEEGVAYISLLWDYDGSSIDLGKVVQATLTLGVSRYIRDIADFSFSIVISGTEYMLCDLNRDGLVNIFDIVVLAGAYNSTSSSPNWNLSADLDGDGDVDIGDVMIVSAQYRWFA